MAKQINLSISEAADVASLLRSEAARLEAEAEGKLHNAGISRRAAAARLQEMAERFSLFAVESQEQENKNNSVGVSRFLAARRGAARNS